MENSGDMTLPARTGNGPDTSNGSLDGPGRFGVAAQQVQALVESITQGTREIDRLVDIVEQSIATSSRVHEAGADLMYEESNALMQRIMDSVESVAKQLEQVSASAMSVSTLVLANMTRNLQASVSRD